MLLTRLARERATALEHPEPSAAMREVVEGKVHEHNGITHVHRYDVPHRHPTDDTMEPVIDKPRREKSTAEVRGAVKRMLRAYVGRIERDGDLEAFAELIRFRAELDAATDRAAAALLADPWRYSFTDLATEVGQTKQNMHRRFGRFATRRDGGQPANLR
jgi:hypothetical protein